MNDFRSRFVDIGLENVALAAARVVELPSRSGSKGVQKRRCLQNVCENHCFPVLKARKGGTTGASLNRRENPIKQTLFGNKYEKMFDTCIIYIYIYINMTPA